VSSEIRIYICIYIYTYIYIYVLGSIALAIAEEGASSSNTCGLYSGGAAF
jgi:hypothetical protein